jgi:hypothetical protein
MTRKPVINRALIADGLLFTTPGDRCRYLGKSRREKPRWLKENAGRYRRLEDVEQESRSAELCRSIENDKKGGAAPTGSNCATSAPEVRKSAANEGDSFLVVTPPQDCSPPTQQASLPKILIPKVLNQPPQPMAPSPSDAARGEIPEPKPETTPLRATVRKRSGRGGPQVKKQKAPTGISKSTQKWSPALMQVVLDSLREYPIFSSAANKAGIHRKTLEYWIRRSEAGDDGYDIELEGFEGFTGRFHKLCQSAIDQAHDDLRGAAWEIAFGGPVYKIDPLLLDRGCQGFDAYARDENGEFIIEAFRPPNMKMLRFLVKRRLAEKYRQNRKINVPQTGGVLVIGMPQEPDNKPKPNTAASAKTRAWKSIARMIGNA